MQERGLKGEELLVNFIEKCDIRIINNTGLRERERERERERKKMVVSRLDSQIRNETSIPKNRVKNITIIKK